MPIALLSLLLAAPVEPVASAPNDPIVVMGRKLDQWVGKFEILGSHRKCRTTKSSGDAEIDGIGCQAFLICADQYQAETDASDEKGIDQPTRRVRRQIVIAHMQACIADRRKILLAQLHERRQATPAQ
jgi:hypothetical protein